MRKSYTLSSLLATLFLTFFLITNIKAQSLENAKLLIQQNASVAALSSEDINNTFIANSYFNEATNTTLVYAQQTYKGIGVYNGMQVFAFKNGGLVSLTGERIKKMDNKVSTIEGKAIVSSADAVRKAAEHLQKTIAENIVPLTIEADGRKITYGTLGISQENIIVELLWVPNTNGSVKLGWQVRILPVKSSDYWQIRVDALDAQILGKDNYTVSCNWQGNHKHNTGCIEVKNYDNKGTVLASKSLAKGAAISTASYRVSPYPAESPNHPGGAFALRTDPWLLSPANSPATTWKWNNDGITDYNITRGNNVHAQEDGDADNATLGNAATSTTALPSLTFDFPFSNSASPTTTVNQSAALTNLFYWNNIMHDISYLYGFNEVSGNFQNYNAERGGLGNDYVVADGQDASGTNNANFSTPADGSAPRMQMFLWSPTNTNILHINTPVASAGYVAAVESNFSTANKLSDVGPVTANVVLYNDQSSETHIACTPASNASQLLGKIALIYRVDCDFVIKVKNAQLAGAIGVIMVNNVPGALVAMSGSDNTITIPAVFVSDVNGAILNSLIASTPTLNVTLSGSPAIDGDLDNGVMAHEYTHGISNRLTGGPSNSGCLQNAEQMGEGWSDYFALMATTNWANATVNDGSISRGIGTYAIGQPTTGSGIRTYPYSTNMSVNPWTYAMLSTNTGGESHTVGEIWCTALWEMTWSLIQSKGINGNLFDPSVASGNSIAMKLVTEGMKLQPCSPGFLDGRNAILKADTLLYNGANSCTIWSAFAKRGMGYNAVQGSSASYTDQTASYTMPSSAIVKKTANKLNAAMNEEITYSFKVTSQCVDIAGFFIVDTLATNVTYVAGSGGNYNASNRTVTFNNINVPASISQTLSFKVKVNTGTYSAPVQHINETVPTTTLSTTWLSTSNVTTKWIVSASRRKSDPYSFFAQNIATASAQVLTTSAAYNLTRISSLSFWHYYDTESGYDGGVVEISLNGGSSWTDLGSYIVQNGYNSVIASNSGTALANRKAFTGSSNAQFIQTVINLAPFAGYTNVKFRFRFVTDAGGAGTGWYVDDISLKSESGVYNAAKLFNDLGVAQSTSDTVTFILNALPVQWGNFTAEKRNNIALLKWSTIQEQNSDKFYVERSTNGIEFSTIGVVKAAGNSNEPKFYQLQDGQPLKGINYYRIKETDIDGRVIYSEIKTLYFDAKGSIAVISPNPAKDKIAISVPGNNNLINVQLLNVAGQQLKVYSITGQYGQFQLPQLASGTYYIKLVSQDIAETHKLIIQ